MSPRQRRLRDLRALQGLARRLEGPGPGRVRWLPGWRGVRRPVRRSGPVAWLARALVAAAAATALGVAISLVWAPDFGERAARAWAGLHAYVYDTGGIPPAHGGAPGDGPD